MKRIVPVFCLILCLHLHAQNRVIDSLEKLIQRVPEDSGKVKMLNAQANEYFKISDFESMLRISQKAKTLAEKINYLRGLGYANISIGVYHRRKGNNAEALRSYSLALAAMQKDANYLETGRCYGYIASISRLQNNYIQALECYEKELSIAEEVGNNREIADAHLGIATVYSDQNAAAEMLDHTLKAIEFYEKDGYRIGMAISMHNLGSFYESVNNQREALHYYLKAHTLFKELKQSAFYSVSLRGIAHMYSGMGQDSIALSYYTSALDINRRNKDISELSSTLEDMGLLLMTQKQSERALNYFEQAMIYSKIINDSAATSSLLYNTGTAYFQKGRYDKAIAYAQQSLSFIGENGYTDLQLKNEKLLSDSYIKKGNDSKGLLHYKKHIQLRDSLYSRENAEKLLRVQIRNEFKKKVDEANLMRDQKEALMKEENKISELRLSRNRIILIGLLLLLVFTVLGGWLYLRQNRIKTRQQTAELNQKLLHSQMDPHFIFNSINSVQEYILSNKTDLAQHYLSEFAKMVRMVLNHTRQNKVSCEEEILLLRTYIGLEAQRIRSEIQFTFNHSDDLDLQETMIPSILLQPVVENAIWHGLRHSSGEKSIRLDFCRWDTNLKIEIADTGVGPAEGSQKQGSHGLNMIKERIALMYKGKLPENYFSIRRDETKKETVVTLIFPIDDEA